MRNADIKKSNFVEVLASEGTDYFDLVRNGQNLKIKQSNLLQDFGTTGTLEALGEITASPILYKNGSVNYIRNLFAGPGISLAFTPQNALKVSHNFYVDATEIPIITDALLDQPRVRSLKAGTGITIAATGDVIQIATAAVPGSTKTVYVYQESDFPTPSLGVITLADETEYRLQTDITTVNRFIMGSDTVISSPYRDLISLTYTGVGDMFTSVDKSFTLMNITVNCPAGSLFDISSTTGTHAFYMTNSIGSCTNIGSITGMRAAVFDNAVLSPTNIGLLFFGNIEILMFNFSGLVAPGAGAITAIDLGTAVFDTVSIINCYWDLDAGSYCISGLAASGNISAGNLGTVTHCRQSGSSTFLQNISPYDDRWEFIENANAVNSANLALATRSGGTVAIAAISTPVLIGATWVSQDMHRFTHDANGKWTYTGKGAHVEVDITISGARAAVGTDTFAFYLYKNGVQIAGSSVTRVFTADTGNITLVWSLELATNDYIELWIENQTGTADFTVSKITLRVG